MQGLAQAALESIDPGQAAMAGEAMASTYARVRSDVREAIPEQYLEEFDRLFPIAAVQPLGAGRGALIHSPTAEAQWFNMARALLASLAGWVNGFVEESRMRMEAQAYAEARVKEERGVGFKGSAN